MTSVKNVTYMLDDTFRTLLVYGIVIMIIAGVWRLGSVQAAHADEASDSQMNLSKPVTTQDAVAVDQ